MKKIHLQGKAGHSKFAIVDDEDFEYLNNFRWYLVKGYARSSKRPETGNLQQKMHHFLVKLEKDKMVDHINRDRLDNRKANLRLVSSMDNVLNSSFVKDAIGIYKCKNSWQAKICYNGKQVYLGNFTNEHDAHMAYIGARKFINTFFDHHV